MDDAAAVTGLWRQSYDASASQALFPLGGIGTGTISLGPRGNLTDWEIFNHPSRGCLLPASFFCIRADDGTTCDARVLESKLLPPFTGRSGVTHAVAPGLPRFDSSRMDVAYPFACVSLTDPDFPAEVTLEAFNPFIPLRADDSGIPAVVLRYSVRNTAKRPLCVSVCGCVDNAVGFQRFDPYGNMLVSPGGTETFLSQDGLSGVFLENASLPGDHLTYGSMALASPMPGAEWKSWRLSNFRDALGVLWRFFSQGKSLGDVPPLPEVEGGNGFASLMLTAKLSPGESAEFPFFLSWHFPNRPRGWQEDPLIPVEGVVRNHYALRYQDAWSVCLDLHARLEELQSSSRLFSNAFCSSTLPSYVLEAACVGICALRSTTCFRLEDGTFAAWEGSNDQSGSCFGTCTHVWNYAQTAAYLFPELERSARRVSFLLETDQDGHMAYRSCQLFGLARFDGPAAIDGQLGSILQLYREWRFSGDNEFLRKLWPAARRALNFVFEYWDPDGDYLPEKKQHNTYDIDFFGPNPLSAGLFCAALKAGAEMADAVGDSRHSALYADAWPKCASAMESTLWNGSYYAQQEQEAHFHQCAQGCLADQLLGQMLALQYGLGHVLPASHCKKALGSIYRFNLLPSAAKSAHTQRTYALNEEAGLVLCTWPDGNRPLIPFSYCDEVWTGVEYQVAAHMIWEDMLQKGLSIVRSARLRFDGIRRSPWCDEECGYHYVRSMAGWAVFTALGGFHQDMRVNSVSFQPRIHPEQFRTFWCSSKGWGTYTQTIDSRGNVQQNLTCLYGETATLHPVKG